MTILVPLETFKTSLGLSKTDLSQDEFLTSLLEQASQAVETKIGYPLKFGPYQHAITLLPDRVIYNFLLPVRPIYSVTGFTRNGEKIDAIYNINSKSGVIEASPGQAWRGGRWVIDYIAGYLLPGDQDNHDPIDGVEVLDLPADIRHAALIWARWIYFQLQRDPTIRSESETGIGSTNWADLEDGCPPGVMSYLEDYRGGGLL